jgi:DNA-binding response OmpR family regulator
VGLPGEPVLIVGADELEARMLALALSEADLAVSVFPDVHTMSAQVNANEFALLILIDDNDNYVDCVSEVRKLTQVLLVLLTDNHRENHQIAALEAGADLVLARPYSARFLVVQLPILIQRFRQGPLNKPSRLQSNHFCFDINNHVVHTRNGSWLQLSRYEFRLLYTLMSKPGCVIATETLIKQVWGSVESADRKMMRKLIHRLRCKLEDEHQLPRCIFNVPNAGYYFKDSPDN